MTEPTKRTRRELPILQLLPNLLTIGAICAGLTAVRFAFQGYFEMSVALIVLAAVLDGIDGRLARLLKSESEIGAELDSLADFVNFGVAPALTMYLWALQDTRGAGWIAVLIFAVCCVMRLARFNVGNRAVAEKAQERDFFVGVPSPAGGLLAFLPFYVSKLYGGAEIHDVIVAGWLILAGLLMIGRFPTPSIKAAKVHLENVKFVMIGFVALVALLLTYPWSTLVGCSAIYLAALTWAWLKRLRNRPTAG